MSKEMPALSRRSFIQSAAAAALASTPVLQSRGAAASRRGPAQRTLSMDRNWLFGGKFQQAALDPSFADASFARVTLPHTVTPLSWQNWNPDSWQDVWVYRRHFAVPPQLRGLRLFLHFDRVMAAATPVLNGHALPQHLGGYLPFDHEITGLVNGGDNVLAVEVDSRYLAIPPAGNPKGPKAVDYLLPGGITGSVSLRAVPAIFLGDVFAKPVDVLHADRRVEVACTVDAAASLPASVRLEASLRHAGQTVATASRSVKIEMSSQAVSLTLSNLGNILLWSPENPHLYDVVVTLFHGDRPIHRYNTRIGFREARFSIDGFFLNGKRTQLFGLDRHELYPYLGYSAPSRLQRRDAEILRRQFNCNSVRCSHYPQSEAFLDACDELGLMVWEEPPGWGYVGDQAWQDLVLHDVEAMIRRDRNHASIVIWGVRVNESRNYPALYERTRAVAQSLDGARPTSGSMTVLSTDNWRQDVYAYDDYHSAPDGSVGIHEPVPGVPYMLSETVGQFTYGGRGFTNKYRRAGDPALQSAQAVYHAQAHDRAAAFPRCSGVIAWCAFDYASLMNDYQAVKCPGVADVFRIPKLGAAFYLAHIDPSVRPVIEPGFYWDFGPNTPTGPGRHAAIFSNCDRLELFVGGKPHAVLHPDRANYLHLKYPPFFADLQLDGAAKPELRIDGFVGKTRVLSRSFSADSSLDSLWLHADDSELTANGADATRLVFRIVDKYGAQRPFVTGEVSLAVAGPGQIVGDNPFQLAGSGGAGAVWIKTIPGRAGVIAVTARHSSLGSRSLRLQAREDPSASELL
jgi:beta-galactosidase